MKAVIVLFGLVAMAVAQSDDLLQRTDYRDPTGQDSHSYATAKGTQVSETTILKVSADGKFLVPIKTGKVGYYSPDGVFHYSEYVADEDGFKFSGDDLPKPIVV